MTNMEKFEALQAETTQTEISFRPTEKVYLHDAKKILMEMIMKDINDKIEMLKSMGMLIHDEQDTGYVVSEIRLSKVLDELVVSFREKERMVKNYDGN